MYKVISIAEKQDGVDYRCVAHFVCDTKETAIGYVEDLVRVLDGSDYDERHPILKDIRSGVIEYLVVKGDKEATEYQNKDVVKRYAVDVKIKAVKV